MTNVYFALYLCGTFTDKDVLQLKVKLTNEAETEVLVFGKSQVKVCCAEIRSIERGKWQLVVLLTQTR